MAWSKRVARKREKPPGSGAPNLLAINFPTDSITLRNMRELQANLFQSGSLLDAHAFEILAIGAHIAEITIARKAFAAAMGLPDPAPTIDIAEDRAGLADAYADLGIAPGKAAARVLIAKIEAAARTQAEAIKPGHRKG